MYHEKPGIKNTEKTLEVVFQYAKRRDIKNIVIASTTGYTAEKVLEKYANEGLNIVVVTHNTGFSEEGH